MNLAPSQVQMRNLIINLPITLSRSFHHRRTNIIEKISDDLILVILEGQRCVGKATVRWKEIGPKDDEKSSAFFILGG